MTVIAMWSGPRSLSTALMRAFENRPDTVVWDEPFYAHYLAATGIDHPGREASIAAGETDCRRVVELVLAPPPGDAPIYFQKHMCHHMLPDVDRSWLAHVRNAFLIREPAEMLLSLWRGTPRAGLSDTGLVPQREIFEQVRRQLGEVPPVIDARTLSQRPRPVLEALCDRLAIGFDDAMLSWPEGPRERDGPWASHWYAGVEASRGFEPLAERHESIPAEHEGLLRECERHYEELSVHRLEV
jgi:hypothetical protein